MVFTFRRRQQLKFFKLVFICFICEELLRRFISPSSSQSSEYRFPPDFVFGVSSSAYQIEGAWNEDGKGENNWEHYIHENPDLVEDRSDGDITCDSYHKWREDVDLVKGLGTNFYRFSISWSRILPTGGAQTEINPKGVEYYNNLIDALLADGVQPYVTMYHWDLPQALQNKGGWLNETIIDDFIYYATLLFELYGDRVKHWMTLNEIAHFCGNGYGAGSDAPFWKMPGVGDYDCTHNALLAHGKVYRIYEKQFKLIQRGKVGIALDNNWAEPLTDSYSDHQAAELYLEFNSAWFLTPILLGDYPEVMRHRVDRLSEQQGFNKSRLPRFTPEEIAMLNGTADFIGLNSYTTFLCTLSDDLPQPSRESDAGVLSSQDPTWWTGTSDWNRYTPWGLRRMLNWIKEKYNNPIVMVTENGWSNEGVHLNDLDRIQFLRGYLAEILNAIYEDGCNVVGYSVWSLLDSFEWTTGIRSVFGLVHVDFNSPNRTRTKRLSYNFYKDTISNKRIA